MDLQAGDFTLESKRIGALPIVNHFIDRARLSEILERGVAQSGNAQLTHAQVILILARSILLERHPFYGLHEWAASYAPGWIGLGEASARVLNDDRVGRAMDALFESDRASLMTEIVLTVIKGFEVDLSHLHNDSTSVTFSGQYDGPREYHGKKAAHITEGHNKDHRPDLKQLVFSLSISRDGAVPIHFKTYDGNKTDDRTHIETWETLRRIAGRSDFIYVADCKLCTREQMEHIAGQAGKFITVLPKTRTEDQWFRQWMATHPVDWQEILRRTAYRKTPLSRLGIESYSEHVYFGFESPVPSKEGYRIVWILSSQKREQDARLRQKRIQKSIDALVRLKTKVGRAKLKTETQINDAVAAILAKNGSGAYFRWKTVSIQSESFRQKNKGRPGRDTEYVRTVKQGWTFEALPDEQAIQGEALVDGIFPLITNIPSRELAMKEILLKYKYQPYLEKRHEQLKSVLDVAPVFLKSPHRVEALLFVYFIALMLNALIEREVRSAMTRTGVESLSLYPEQRKCRHPATARILEIYSDQRKNRLHRNGKLVQTFADPLTPLQRQILRLLKISPNHYTAAENS